MIKKEILLLIVFLITFSDVFAQKDSTAIKARDEAALQIGIKNYTDAPRGRSGIRVMFCNAENFFNPEDDPNKNDDDFTPEGNNHWSYGRYNEKISHLYKVITAVGGWELPAVVGMCEVEEISCLKDLIKNSPLKKHGFKAVLDESPDKRGIDVGLLYMPSKFQYISHESIVLRFPFDTTILTRNILHVWGRVLNKDTLHVFVNHWPSRLGGQAASEPRRVFAAQTVRKKVDQLLKENPNAKIVIMGDFNDHTEDKSVHEVLGAEIEKKKLDGRDLYNFMGELDKNWKLGSHKFQGEWGTLDQVIVSQSLLYGKGGKKLHASEIGAQIFAARFLLEPDTRYFGLQPKRTYIGPRYHGGFSDHLPVYIDLFYGDKK